MNEKFETLGNATLQFFADGRPILATDPWLVGTCYFGSWALDHALTPEQIGNVVTSDYIWLSHGHPDHLHHQSLDMLPRGKKVLLPDHYDPEVRNFLTEQGFSVTIMTYRQWYRLSPTFEVLCLDNINQDAVLVARLGDALVINLNDSPLAGEFSFLHGLVKNHPNSKTYLAALCSIDADMFNFVDAEGRSIAGPPDERKPGAIWNVARSADRLGVKHFCCSSSQHIYVRPDSVWANDYRISWQDLQRHWSRPNVELIEPFVTIDVASGEITANDPEHLGGDRSQIADSTGDDDWNERPTEEEWGTVDQFFRRFDLLPRYVDFIEVVIGGATHRIEYNAHLSRKPDARGIRFYAPKHSFMETMKWGYFDDLLIGNFMKVHLTNTSLYPRFTPLVAKLGGNAKVYTNRDYAKFRQRYFRRNPIGTLTYYVQPEMNYVVMPWLRETAEAVGFKRPLKYLYRALRGDPIPKGVTDSVPLKPPKAEQFLKFRPDQRPTLVVVVDTEENFDWNAPYDSAATAVHGMQQIVRLQAVFDRYGVKPIYMIDYAVASQAEGYGPLMEPVAAGRCEIGAHLHPWVNPPLTEALSERNSYPSNLPPELERVKLRNLTAAIEANLGVRPRSYKAGRYGIGATTIPTLIDEGYEVDLSVVPTRSYSADGGPDFTGFTSIRPFWMDEQESLLELPFTIGLIGALSGSGSSLFRKLDSKTGQVLHLPGIFARLGMLNRVGLTPEGVKISEAKALTRHLVAQGERFFAIAFHSTSLSLGSTPYVTDAAALARFYQWLEMYFDFFANEIGGTFKTPIEYYSELRDQGRVRQPADRVASG
jgi:hypothetical protein